jgi:hypothetical protein
VVYSLEGINNIKWGDYQMAKKISVALILGSAAVVVLGAEPQGSDTTLKNSIDTANYTIYRYVDSLKSYKVTYQPKEPEKPRQLPTVQQENGSHKMQQRDFITENKKELSNEKKVIVQAELKSASTNAKVGATFYGIGFCVEVIGAIVLISDLSSNSNNNPYYSSPSDPPLTGLYIALGGGATSLIGAIVANSGGSKARNTLEAAYGEAPPFNGWGYFLGGISCSVVGSLLNYTEVPILPSVISLTGTILELSSVIHSVNYTNRAYLKSFVLKNIHISPMVDMKSFKPNGIMISGSF